MPDINDYTEELDYNALKNNIKNVLRRYFEYDDHGEPNANYDPNFAPQDALDEIHDIVGDI